ncbi:hypothetical protein, partial [Brevundimonas sp.]|uniref:hypothetical protein n=1 Tax=Brevundimonas sp. TaxID=1871086 RepID=UPI0028972AA2
MSDADDKSTPFARRPVQWGRPPQTIFRAGPLPRGVGLTPPLAPTPRTAAPGAEASGVEPPRPASRPAITTAAAP